MGNKILAIFIGFFMILVAFLYIYLNESYRLAFRAKVYYEIGNYEKSYAISKIAYKQDKYNNMAFMVFKNSQNELKLQKYISQGNEYMGKIKTISNGSVQKADKERIKLMCDVMIDDFNINLKDLVSLDLYQNAKIMMGNFYKLKSDLFYYWE